MAKKLLLLSPVMLVLLYLGTAGESPLDVLAQLKLAERYQESGDYQEAEAIYKQVVSEDPNTQHAFLAQRKLTALYVCLDEQQQAQDALEELIAGYSEYKGWPHMIHQMTQECSDVGKGHQARQLCQYVLDDQPDSQQAIWLQMGVALSSIYLGDDDTAAAAIEVLDTEFSQDGRTVMAVNQIGLSYFKLEQYEMARLLYLHAGEKWPKSRAAIFSQRGVVLCDLALANKASAWLGIQRLQDEFAESKNLPKVLNKIAGACLDLAEYEKARELNQYVVDEWPESKETIFSQRGVVLCDLALGNEASAWLGVQRLLDEFSDSRELPEVLNRIAKAYLDLAEYEKARELYQYVLATWPDAEEVAVSLKGVAVSSIGLGDDPNAEAAIEALITGFPESEHTPNALYIIGRKLKGDARAAALYQHIIENYPGDEIEILAKAKVGSILVQSGDLDAAQATLDYLLVDYSGHPSLPRAVAVMANGYYSQALLLEGAELHDGAEWFYRKAIAECKRVVTQLPETPRVTAEACYFLAVCHERLAEYGRAIDYYQKVVDTWPDYKYAWHALFKIGCCYEELSKSGVISEWEADQITRPAYQQLLAQYPDCKVVPHTRSWLSRHNSR